MGFSSCLHSFFIDRRLGDVADLDTNFDQAVRGSLVILRGAGICGQRRIARNGLAVPGFCLVIQGSKEILLGDNCYRYDPDHYLISTVELPATGCAQIASADRPYLGLRLNRTMRCR